MRRKQIPAETLIDLERRLNDLPARSGDRRGLVERTAEVYGVSIDTLYRALRERVRPKPLRRVDHGKPRVLPKDEMETYCEVIAAIKVRTSNRKGRHLSTVQSIRLLRVFRKELDRFEKGFWTLPKLVQSGFGLAPKFSEIPAMSFKTGGISWL